RLSWSAPPREARNPAAGPPRSVERHGRGSRWAGPRPAARGGEDRARHHHQGQDDRGGPWGITGGLPVGRARGPRWAELGQAGQEGRREEGVVMMAGIPTEHLADQIQETNRRRVESNDRMSEEIHGLGERLDGLERRLDGFRVEVAEKLGAIHGTLEP